MSNLKNTYGFSQSLLDAILSVQENALKGKQSKIDVAKPKGELTTADFKKLRTMKKQAVQQQNNSYEPEGEQIDEEKTQLKANSKATMYKHDNGDYSIVRPDGKVVHYGTKDSATKLWNQIYASGMKEEVELVEAQNLVPLITQLKALLSWLVSSGAIRKFAKEEAEVVGMLELLEYRTKGAVGKKNRPAPSKESGEGHSEKGETKQQENDEDMPYAYARASRDGRPVIPDLRDAAQDKQGGTIQSSNGERPVSQKVAQLLHDHLMKMKPAERAEHSAHIFNGKVPNVKTLNHIKTQLYIKKLGAEKKFGSDEGVKRGRGRPKKVQ